MTSRSPVRLDLLPEPASVGAARRFVRGVLAEWDLEELADTAVLLTSELATNAVLHARTPYAVLVGRSSAGVRVDVLDGARTVAVQRASSPTATTGRGVSIVDRLAQSWGSTEPARLDGFEKGVFFVVPTDGDVAG